jgi:hypothetical protein
MEGEIIELSVVRAAPRADRRGIPLILSARCFIRICRWIEEGRSAVESCRMEGVTYALFRKRVGQYASFRRRLREAEEVREHFLREFHIANITQHSAKTVAASMFWLERKYPNEFSLRSVIREEVNSAAQEVFGKISLEQLIENARLAKEVAENPPPGLLIPPNQSNSITS